MNAETLLDQGTAGAVSLTQPSNLLTPSLGEESNGVGSGLDADWNTHLAPLDAAPLTDTDLSDASSSSASPLTLVAPSGGDINSLLGETGTAATVGSALQDGLTQETQTRTARNRSNLALSTFAATAPTPAPIRVEAESMSRINYRLESSSQASGGEVVTFLGGASNENGSVSTNFQGSTGRYNVVLGYFDENDGEATIETRIAGRTLDSVRLDQNLGSNRIGSNNNVRRVVASDVLIEAGDRIELVGQEEQSEHARIDYIEFVPVSTSGGADPPPAPPAPPTPVGYPIRLEAEAMNRSVYRVESTPLASGNGLVSLKDGAEGETGRLNSTFEGASGTYNVVLGYFDEDDGVATIQTRIGDRTIATTRFDQDFNNDWIGTNNRVRQVIAENVTIQQGEQIEVLGQENDGEYARVDYLEFIPVSTSGGGGGDGGDGGNGGGGAEPPTPEPPEPPPAPEPPADTTAPTASLTASNLTSSGSDGYRFTVSYSDDSNLDAATVGNGDVRVTGPNGFDQAATLVSFDESSATATYSISAPGGTWDDADNGTYAVEMQGDQVDDASGNSVAAGTLGSFDVTIPGSGDGGNLNPRSPLAPPEGFGAIGSSTGRVLYVSPSGNDSNSGLSQGAAFRTASRALSAVRPGETIVFGAGTYSALNINDLNGTSGAPITLKADRDAVFRTGTFSSGAAIRVRDSSHLILDGLVATESLWGIMAEGVQNTTIRNSHVHNVGQEAVHVRSGSSHVLIAENRIHDTGRRGSHYARWGEGVYIGDGRSGGERDGTHHVAVHKNEIFRTSSEAIDLKRGLNNLIAEYNTIYDVNTKVRAAVNVMEGAQGNEFGYIVRGNVIRNISGDLYNSDGTGIRIFGGGVDVYNNVVYNNEAYGIRSEGTVGGPRRIYNNTVFDGGYGGDIVDDGGRADIRNNIGSSRPGNIPSTASLFVNAAAGDFRLAPSATRAIDQGVELSTVARDMSGVARPQGGQVDLGAIEFIPAGTTPATPPPAPEPPTPPPAPEPPMPEPPTEPFPPATQAVRLEAEAMNRSVYRTESHSAASGGQVVTLVDGASGETGELSTTFEGESGTYDVVLTYFDENDGQATVETRVGDRTIATTQFDQELGSNYMSSGNQVRQVIASDVNIQQGDRIQLIGREDSGEYARIDAIEFVPPGTGAIVEPPPAPAPAPPDNGNTPPPSGGSGNPQPRGQLIYQNDGTTLNGLGLEYGSSNQIAVEDGAIRMFVPSGDRLWSGSNGTHPRAEAKVQLNDFQDETYWFTYDMQMGSGHNRSGHTIVTQLHGMTGSRWPSPQATFRIEGGELRFETAINEGGRTRRATYARVPIQEGDWLNIAIRTRFSDSNDGFHEVWINGEKVVSEFNIQTIDRNKTLMLFKFGAYRQTNREMLFDNIRIYKE